MTPDRYTTTPTDALRFEQHHNAAEPELPWDYDENDMREEIALRKRGKS